MSALTNEQVTALAKRIQNTIGVNPHDNNELMDHLACMIESEMEQGLHFTDALEKTTSSFTAKEISTLSLSTYGLWNQLRNRRYSNKYSIVIGLLLCVWILGDYLTAVFFNVTELGAIYGLLSMVIIFGCLYKATNHFTKAKSSEAISFKQLYAYQMKIVARASMVVLLFLLPYLGYVNTHFYGLYEGPLEIPPFTMSIAIIIGTSIGIIAEGLLVALTTSWIQRRRMSV